MLLVFIFALAFTFAVLFVVGRPAIACAMRRIQASGALMGFATIRRTTTADVIAAGARLERSAQRNTRTVSSEGAVGVAVVKLVGGVLNLLGGSTVRCA